MKLSLSLHCHRPLKKKTILTSTARALPLSSPVLMARSHLAASSSPASSPNLSESASRSGARSPVAAAPSRVSSQASPQ